MTNEDFIRDTLLAIGVVPEGVDATPEQAQTALRAMNELAREWADAGVSINWSTQTDPALPCMLIGGELAAARYALALRLCPLYGRDPPLAIVALADTAYTRLLRTQLNRALEPVDPVLPAAEGGYSGYSIVTDTF